MPLLRKIPCLVVAALLGMASTASAALPAGFSKSFIGGPWSRPVGLTFDANGRMYVWERDGRVWIVENGVKSAAPLVDITDEVAHFGDHGLLGFALHPNFLENGWIYLFYAVDPYYLANAGTPGYDPNQDGVNEPTIARITRYTARSSDGFHSVDPASRRILFGEAPGAGCPLVHLSHGVGSLVFGNDDSLLASCGEGSSYLGPDTGGTQYGAFIPQALAEGIIAPKEDVGALRAQLLASFGGKILRLDPQSGDGLPSNPYYDATNPRSAPSRVYALGFRNPFRFTVRPDTGSHVQADGRPGSLYVGNVGWNTWEELEVVGGAGYNSGWPVFEGPDPQPDYAPFHVVNQDAPNPLYGKGGCFVQPYFYFDQLVIQESLGPPSFPNPCDASQQIPASIPHWVQHRPTLAIGRNASGGPWVTPTFSGSTPTTVQVGAPGSPVSGTNLIGASTITGGVWYEGSDFPAQYQNSFFMSDYGYGQISNVHFDGNDQPTQVATFDDSAGGVTMLATSPTQGALYGVDNGDELVYRIAYTATSNQPPVAQASATPFFGPTPLSVAFSSAGSADPEGLALGCSWNFGDGSPASTAPNPTHTFFAPLGVPVAYTVTLTVTDSVGQRASDPVQVAVNDTPPAVAITSPPSQGLFTMTQTTAVPLTATISDAEQTAAQLRCSWEVDLFHNGHVHPGSVDPNCSSSAQVTPVGCDGNDYHYVFTLTVDDGAGLSTTRQTNLYPDCATILPAICGNLDASPAITVSDVLRLRAALANPVLNGLTPGELSRCSVVGDTACDVADLTVLRRWLGGKAPGLSPVCPAAAP